MADDYTSILDKTDWRKTIHKALQDAVLSIGREDEFWYNVEQAIEAIKANYPNWNATLEIDEGIDCIKKKHEKAANDYMKEHKLQMAYPWNYNRKIIEWKNAMYREILQFLKDVAGKHRMLLWGIKSTPGGTIGPGENVDALWDESNP